MVDVLPQNVTVVDDRNGNTYWIFDVHHVTGAASDVQVENSVISASHLPDNKEERGIDIQVTADDDATDAVREITILTGQATGTYKIVARFAGTAGTGSGHEDK